jgi:hypothetical protein
MNEPKTQSIFAPKKHYYKASDGLVYGPFTLDTIYYATGAPRPLVRVR